MIDGVEVIDAKVHPLAVPTETSPPSLQYRTPQESLNDGINQAKVLTKIIEGNPHLVVVVQGHKYPKVEIWETLGEFNQLSARTEWTRKMNDGSYEARVEIVDRKTGFVVGAAEAECSRDEEKWAKSMGYSLRSMAQTRAVSKAYRMKLAWIVVLAGMDPTPAEEVPSRGFERAPRRETKPAAEQPPPPTPTPPAPPQAYPWDEDRKKLQARIFLLADKYADAAPIRGGAFKTTLQDDASRHALIRDLYKVDGMRYCTNTQLDDLARKIQKRIDGANENASDPFGPRK